MNAAGDGLDTRCCWRCFISSWNDFLCKVWTALYEPATVLFRMSHRHSAADAFPVTARQPLLNFFYSGYMIKVSRHSLVSASRQDLFARREARFVWTLCQSGRSCRSPVIPKVARAEGWWRCQDGGRPAKVLQLFSFDWCPHSPTGGDSSLE